MTTPSSDEPSAADGAALDAFLALADAAFAADPAARLVLAKPRAAGDDLQRVTLRAVQLKGAPRVSLLFTHRTRDITKNLERAEALAQVCTLLGERFAHAHLFARDGETQLLTSRKGRRTLLRPKAAAAAPAPAAAADVLPTHDRRKRRYVDIGRDFLVELGVTTASHQLVPAMARKWKQIDKFVEVLDHALADSGLVDPQRREPIRVLDFGAGKGYLTFAMHEHLQRSLAMPVHVTGVELRDDLVALCNGVVAKLGLEGLDFERGDVGSHDAKRVDVMVALHACDTATDHAIHKGVRAGAAIILCSPCCHKELRPQLLSPHPLRPVLKHGVHLGQEAEMLTDSLRALLLDACGYDTQVFEFVSLEHTNKNKMILAVKRRTAHDAQALWRQVGEVKAFYGIRDQCLERLLRADLAGRADAEAA